MSMDFMFDWDNEGDKISFDDSDRFEEDSLCSWISESESVCNNWRGWKKQNGSQLANSQRNAAEGHVTSLVELSAQAVACYIPFEVVEKFPQPIPEQLQLRIEFWSFPENEEDIRLYSCLANGSADEFQRGEVLYKAKAVKDMLQIGFHLSATVTPPQCLGQAKGTFNVALVFDRRRISSCNCTCSSTADWCAHVVALCLTRIHQAASVCLRAPVSESLSQLKRDQLQKFAQYLISELPQQILPTAQRLLDELLSSQQSAINTVCGAPDPTAGPSASEQTSWCLDESTLHENIKKTIIKFCVPSPVVFSDPIYLSSTAPPAAAEWLSLLRPLRGREPEGMWNLLSIVREMYRRNDSNALPLLEILTFEVLQCEQLLVWWFTTKVSTSLNNPSTQTTRGGNSGSSIPQHAAVSLCDEIVALWRLAALNPKLQPIQREDILAKLHDWHTSTIDKVRKHRGSNLSMSSSLIKKSDIELFSGFKSSIEACYLDWEDYPIPGVTYSSSEHSHWKYANCLRGLDGEGSCKKNSRVQAAPVCFEDLISTDNSGSCVHKMGHLPHNMHCVAAGASNGTQSSHYSSHSCTSQVKTTSLAHNSNSVHVVHKRSLSGTYSSGSEGFCEADKTDPIFRDSDSSVENTRDNVFNLDTSDGHGYAASGGGYAASGGGARSKVLPSHIVMLSHQTSLKSEPDPIDIDSDTSLSGAVGEDNILSAHHRNASSSHLACNRVEPIFSESQHSSDEYQLYFYDGTLNADADKKRKEKADEPNYFCGMKVTMDKQETLFARAEALHVHGHGKHACKLAKQLAEQMLTYPPDLLAEAANLNTIKGKGKKKKVPTATLR